MHLGSVCLGHHQAFWTGACARASLNARLESGRAWCSRFSMRGDPKLELPVLYPEDGVATCKAHDGCPVQTFPACLHENSELLGLHLESLSFTRGVGLCRGQRCLDLGLLLSGSFLVFGLLIDVKNRQTGIHSPFTMGHP